MSRETDLAEIVAEFLHRIDDEEGGTIDMSPEPSCQKCTHGTTPNKWAKGDCLRHQAEVGLSKAEESEAPIEGYLIDETSVIGKAHLAINVLGGYVDPDDKYGQEIDTAIGNVLATLETVDKITRALLLVCGSTGESLDDFEEQAAAFYSETLKMRPGKDAPRDGAGLAATHEEYGTWVDEKLNAVRAAFPATLARAKGEAS